jgi:hypothetical protein
MHEELKDQSQLLSLRTGKSPVVKKKIKNITSVSRNMYKKKKKNKKKKD